MVFIHSPTQNELFRLPDEKLLGTFHSALLREGLSLQAELSTVMQLGAAELVTPVRIHNGSVGRLVFALRSVTGVSKSTYGWKQQSFIPLDLILLYLIYQFRGCNGAKRLEFGC